MTRLESLCSDNPCYGAPWGPRVDEWLKGPLREGVGLDVFKTLCGGEVWPRDSCWWDIGPVIRSAS